MRDARQAGVNAAAVLNQGELAALYCFVFLYIAAAGSGVWSLDRAMKRELTSPVSRR